MVKKLKGNTNELNHGEAEPHRRQRVAVTAGSPSQNAAGTYTVGDYKVYVDTKGNTQVRSIFIV